jgi:hypothetical protein
MAACALPISEGLSGGAIFMILCVFWNGFSLIFSLLVAAGVYLLGGVMYKRQQGERGLDQIPNIDFWRKVSKRIKVHFVKLKEINNTIRRCLNAAIRRMIECRARALEYSTPTKNSSTQTPNS